MILMGLAKRKINLTGKVLLPKQSFIVKAHNDLLDAEDVFEAQHYVIKDAMVCVAELDYAKSSISGPKISQFTSY